MSACHFCGIPAGVPADAGVFDESRIIDLATPLEPGREVVLVRFEIHRNYSGILMHFAQYTNRSIGQPPELRTPGYRWELRNYGQPIAPYLSLDHIVNPWGAANFPICLPIGDGSAIELVLRNESASDPRDRLEVVGGRIMGRYWYNSAYGGTPNPL
jgi:hypothetical protein